MSRSYGKKSSMASLRNALLVKPEEANRRLSICRGCEYYRKNTRTCGTPIVGDTVVHEGQTKRLCGCFMELKTQFQGSACSIGIWGDVKTESERLIRAKELIKEIGKSERISRVVADELRGLYRLLVAETNDPGECSKCLVDILATLKKFMRDKAVEDQAEPEQPEVHPGPPIREAQEKPQRVPRNDGTEADHRQPGLDRARRKHAAKGVTGTGVQGNPGDLSPTGGIKRPAAARVHRKR